jgi:ribonucleoside-diphosphate reductase alpha chain
MYMHAWRQKLKTTYYLRSRPATRIAKTTIGGVPVVDQIAIVQDAVEAVSCSLENPESCEACQ